MFTTYFCSYFSTEKYIIFFFFRNRNHLLEVANLGRGVPHATPLETGIFILHTNGEYKGILGDFISASPQFCTSK